MKIIKNIWFAFWLLAGLVGAVIKPYKGRNNFLSTGYDPKKNKP